jgi:SAM-dependent methyltransferase
MQKIKHFIKNSYFFYPIYFLWLMLVKLRINLLDIFQYRELEIKDTFELHTLNQEESDSHDFHINIMRKQKKYDRVLPHINKGSKVLDLACGRGELQVFLEEYLNGDVEYTGLDFTDQRVDSAQKLGRNVIKFDCSNEIELLKFIEDTGPYDVIFCIYALTVFPCPEETLKTIMQSSNKVIVGVANNGHWIYRLRFLFGRSPVPSISHAANYTTNFNEIKRWWTYRDYKFIFKSIGVKSTLLSVKSSIDSRHSIKIKSFLPTIFSIAFVFLLELKDKK